MEEVIEEVRTACARCLAGCAMLVTVKNGVPLAVRGDPESAINRGVLCERGMASLAYAYSDHRIQAPLVRDGPKGENAWRETTWDEALSIVSQELGALRERLGPETVAFIIGGSKGINDVWIHRFANIFGSPNITKAAQHCFLPTYIGSVCTYGDLARPDYEHNDELLILWGINKHETALPEGLRIDRARKRGADLIVIDPAPTRLAKTADLWIRPRPGTDLALALGMISSLIAEGLHDTQFIARHTTGFERLSEHVAPYTPAWAESVTGVSAATIRDLARRYATAQRASIASGNGIEHSVHNVQCARALAILRSITGKIGSPGCDAFWDFSPKRILGTRDILASNALSESSRSAFLNKGLGLLPMMPFALHQRLTTAMKDGVPYPVRGAFVMGSNPLHTWPRSPDVFTAFASLDFLVVADHFMTPTAALADVVLPVATYLETDSLITGEFVPETRVIQKICTIGQSRSDCAIFIELAKRMGLPYGWDSESEALDSVLRPTGATYQDLKKVGGLPTHMCYAESLQDLATPTGTIELYATLLERSGHDPLPVYRDPWEGTNTTAYPLTLTSWKRSPYVHSGNRQIPELRRRHPDPIALIQKDTAESYGIRDGEWCTITTANGSMVHRAQVHDDMTPSTIVAEHGWWYPERGSPFDGWDDANINVLTSNGDVKGREVGTAMLRGIPCTVAQGKPPKKAGSHVKS